MDAAPASLRPLRHGFLFNLGAFPGSHSEMAKLSSLTEIKFFKFHENRLPGKENSGFLFPLWKRGRLSMGS